MRLISFGLAKRATRKERGKVDETWNKLKVKSLNRLLYQCDYPVDDNYAISIS